MPSCGAALSVQSVAAASSEQDSRPSHGNRTWCSTIAVRASATVGPYAATPVIGDRCHYGERVKRDPLSNPRWLIERVYAYAAYRLGDGPDAEDVTSATFERALRYRLSYDPRRGDPAAWLVGIARRCIADQAVQRETPTAEVPDHAIDGHEERTLRRLDVSAAVAHLNQRERELVALRWGADLTAMQIGELLEMRTNAVEVALHRTLGRLRDIVEPPAGSGAASARARPAPATDA